MAKKLGRYRDKRDPARTNEPFGAEPLHSASVTRAGRYVVHLHDATREHYDLRLEVGGVLQSFAIPRGPSLYTTDKRLAVHTENHPLDYLDFEAVIPAGNYGAGPMIMWDRGAVRYLETSAEEGMLTGKIDFVLQGFKLRGRFALVAISGNKKSKDAPKREWLLIKKVDGHEKTTGDITKDEPRSVLSGLRIDELPHAAELAARVVDKARKLGARSPAPHAKDITPMRCSERDGTPDDPKSLYELKLDGVRIIAERNGEHAALRYRTGRIGTAAYPEVVRAVQALGPTRVILDGEIVAFDERGRPSFARLTRRIHEVRNAQIRAAMQEVPVMYFAFDLLVLDDLDLRALPLHVRKQLLAELLPGKGILRMLDHVEGEGSALLELCAAHDLEGIVQKRASSAYVGGKDRSTHWLKIKRVRQDEFVVVGFTHGKGSRKALGALEIASYVGDKLITRGRVGSGLDEAAIARLGKLLTPLTRTQCAAEGELFPAPEGRVFVEPRVVIGVEHAGFTADGRLRHPVYRDVRDDVAAHECTSAPDDEREASLIESATTPSVLVTRTTEARVTTAKTKTKTKRDARVVLTNSDKVFWPEQSITKGNLCEYYASIADTILPYLRDRPVLMVRYPDGIDGKHFFQWNAPAGIPDWIKTQRIHSEEHARDVTFFRVDDVDTLLYIANLGCIPLHVLAARFSDLTRCDFLTIDFDVGDARFADAVTLALALRDLLAQLGLVGYPKTSGQTGLHVLVPLDGAPFTLATTLATLLGSLLHERHPSISTIERRRAKRPKAVYIDTGQTGTSRAIVAPYSVRAHPGATVSTPLLWDEIGQALSPARFDLFSVPSRVQQHGDPMREMLTSTPDIEHAVQALGELLPQR